MENEKEKIFQSGEEKITDRHRVCISMDHWLRIFAAFAVIAIDPIQYE